MFEYKNKNKFESITNCKVLVLMIDSNIGNETCILHFGFYLNALSLIISQIQFSIKKRLNYFANIKLNAILLIQILNMQMKWRIVFISKFDYVKIENKMC